MKQQQLVGCAIVTCVFLDLLVCLCLFLFHLFRPSAVVRTRKNILCLLNRDPNTSIALVVNTTRVSQRTPIIRECRDAKP